MTVTAVVRQGRPLGSGSTEGAILGTGGEGGGGSFVGKRFHRLIGQKEDTASCAGVFAFVVSLFCIIAISRHSAPI